MPYLDRFVLGACLASAIGASPVSAQAPTIDSLLARLKSATASYRVLDSAVAAGYDRDVSACVQHQPHGAMGYHHVNRALLDDDLEVERPEMLVYERMNDGRYKLNGVEFIVPYRARSRDAEPPVILGQKLKRADGLQLWYLHVWLWQPNPNGLFADWNPTVKC
jgi:hypothetical protein